MTNPPERHLRLLKPWTAVVPNPAIAIPCPHCAAAPNQQCGYRTRKRGWTTLVLRRYHPSREEQATTQTRSDRTTE